MKAFNPAGWINGVTIAKVADFQAIASDLYAKGANCDSGGYGMPNTGFVTLIPGALPGTQYTVTSASWSSGSVTYTITGGAVGLLQIVSIAGALAAGYNISNGTVTATTGGTITLALTSNPGTWVSGGTVTVGTAPANGTIACNASNQVQIYSTASSSWGAATTAVAAGVWHSGAGVPSSGLGNNGDMYLNYSTGDVYGAKTTGVWGSIVENIVGATGASGGVWRDGAGVPSSGLGNNGDMYLNSSNGNVYGPKTAGAWGSVVINIVGPSGGVADPGSNGIMKRTALNTTAIAAPADYPVLVASGASHAPGVAPDPGATAGSTHFLREDATWAVPGGSGNLADPGSNGIIKRTALNVTAPAVANTDYMAALGGSGLVSIASGVPAIPSLTAHGVLVGAGAAVPNATAAGTAGQVLTSNGASADPTFQAAAGGGVGSWGALSLYNSWVAINTSIYGTAASAASAQFATCRGQISAGTQVDGTTIASMPVGQRPASSVWVFMAALNSSTGAVQGPAALLITTAGSVNVYGISGYTSPSLLLNFTFALF